MYYPTNRWMKTCENIWEHGHPCAFRGKNKLCIALAAAEVLRNMSHGLMRQISGRSRLLSFPSVPLPPLLNPYLPFLNPSLSVSLRFHLAWPLERESDANTAWSD